VLRATGNLKIVQRLLRHDQVTTTAKYVHALDEDVMEAMQLAAERASAAQEQLANEKSHRNPTEDLENSKRDAG
jgi:hypothetical protein